MVARLTYFIDMFSFSGSSLVYRSSTSSPFQEQGMRKEKGREQEEERVITADLITWITLHLKYVMEFLPYHEQLLGDTMFRTGETAGSENDG
jgi:hypothetical protein